MNIVSNLKRKDFRMKYLVQPYLVVAWFLSLAIVVQGFIEATILGAIVLVLFSPILVATPYVFYEKRKNK